MAKATKKVLVGFRTTQAAKDRIKRIAKSLGYKDVSHYLSEISEAPAKPELLQSIVDRTKLGSPDQL